jgi:hypothetical protein
MPKGMLFKSAGIASNLSVAGFYLRSAFVSVASPAVTEPDVSNLHQHRHAAQQSDFVAEIEPIGFPRVQSLAARCLTVLLGRAFFGVNGAPHPSCRIAVSAQLRAYWSNVTSDWIACSILRMLQPLHHPKYRIAIKAQMTRSVLLGKRSEMAFSGIKLPRD